ncbi:putative ABC-type sugar transport system periplasmic component [Actinacidiphila reveromycinica]|uniref:Putative ABC-type sugar transport system periplasmic component n=1 Tax=Actinacidiphila reveromycinica TaxID=659352 RepID=A0A7U3VM69_9ACTN|nr:extracellular solute-binding protein [Streptomyces sp. SN-593]BBA96268.1 putative ABC-type sugar transport system periplasmic component [Streptomyces sp. SN-593]
MSGPGNDRRDLEGVNRRRVLGMAGAAVGAAALAACSGKTGSPVPQGDVKDLKLPTQVTPSPVPGQVVSGTASVPVAFTRYPDPYKTVTEPPGRGGTVTTFQVTYTPPPPADNRWADELDKRLGVHVKPTLVSPADLAQKTATVIAGGDIPDLFYLNTATGQAPAAAQSVLQGAFTDLTEYLSGDAVRDYPNLALFPSYAWKNSSIEGRIYGVPRPEPLLQSGIPTLRLDWMRKLGMTAQPGNADEMYAMLTGFSGKDPNGNGKKDTWALSSLQIYWQSTPILNMFGVPNNWRLEKDGSLTKDIETDEFEAATEYIVKLWKAGAFHPNAAANTYDQQMALWNAGKIGMSGAALNTTYIPDVPPIPGVGNWATDLGPLIAPGHDGGTASLYQSSGIFGMFAIPAKVGNGAKGKERVKELLSILNYLGAPFGSEENTFLTYGIEGWNYDLTHGTPVKSTSTARRAELAGQYFNEPTETVLYLPGPPSMSVTAQKQAEKLIPHTVADPTVNLISQSSVSKGPALQQNLNDAFVGIVTGRKPVSALKELRSQWSGQGGDAIRREFQQSLAKSR